MSGFLTPSSTTFNGAITAGLAQYGGVDTRNMWGLPQLGRWKWHDPDVHVQLLADNNTRLWVYSPSTLTCSDPPAMIGYCDQAQGSNRSFYQHYRSVGGHNAHFDFPDGPQHDWGSWSGQLAAMTGELVGAIRESGAAISTHGACPKSRYRVKSAAEGGTAAESCEPPTLLAGEDETTNAG